MGLSGKNVRRSGGRRHHRDPAPGLDQQLQHGALESEVVRHHIEALGRRRSLGPENLRHPFGELVRGGSGDAGHQVPAFHARRVSGSLDQRGGRVALAADDTHLRTLRPQVPDQLPGVETGDAHHAGSLQVAVQRLLGAPVAGRLAQVSHHHSHRVGVSRLLVLRVGPDVAHLRRGHGDDLADVARVGQNFLVPGHRRVEDHLANALAGGAKGSAFQHHSIRQGQGCALQGVSLPSAPSNQTGRPPTKVWTTRPTIRIPA